MKVDIYNVVEAQVGETLDEMKQGMFRLCKALNVKPIKDDLGEDWSNTRVFGIFNGQLYVCYKYYENYKEIDRY